MIQKEIDKLTLGQRLKAPTPKLFGTLKIIGLTLAAASGALLAAPVALPAIVVTVASYIAVASSVVTAISQITVQG
jgi:energy-converting hydrogenase Eha subunit G